MRILNGLISQAAAVAAALMLVAGCGDQKSSTESQNSATSKELQPDQVTSNARMFLYSGGHKTTDLKAEEIRQFTKRDSTVAEKLMIEFFDTTGARISTLTAQGGYIREKDNYLAVAGDVVVIGEDSIRLETQYLEWVGAKDSVVTDSFVTVIFNKSDTVMSYGFQSDPRLKNITFKRQVSGRLTDVKKVTDE